MRRRAVNMRVGDILQVLLAFIYDFIYDVGSEYGYPNIGCVRYMFGINCIYAPTVSTVLVCITCSSRSDRVCRIRLPGFAALYWLLQCRRALGTGRGMTHGESFSPPAYGARPLPPSVPPLLGRSATPIGRSVSFNRALIRCDCHCLLLSIPYVLEVFINF
jgi:hypothetical protein